MNEVSFVEQREKDWRRLNFLCDRADASPTQLSPSELHEFVRLYRKASSDLALIRTRSTNLQLIEFLNDLTARSYSTLYRPTRGSLWKAIGIGAATAAQTVRRLRWFVLASALTFLVGIFFSYYVLDHFPQARDFYVPAGFQDAFEQWKHPNDKDRGLDQSVAMTGMYSSNNPRVAVMTGAISASTFGVGSAFMLWQNGCIMGALLHEVAPYGQFAHVIIWVLPHGVTEISGLILSGTSGYVIGWALIAPGRRKRGAALKQAGKDAIVVLSTAAVLMFIAAPIEGFFSFNPRVPDWVKILFALGAATAWFFFWTGYAQTPETKRTSEQHSAFVG